MGLMNAGTAVGAVAAPTDCADAGVSELALGLLPCRCLGADVDVLVDGRVLSGLATSPPDRKRAHKTRRSSCRKARRRASDSMDRSVALSANRRSCNGQILSDAAWYFYIFWLPKYLYDVHHFDTKQVGTFAWIRYAAAGVGRALGGWFSSRLIQRGFSVNSARKIALGISAAVMPSILLVMHSPVQCNCPVQYCVCRPAIVVHTRDDITFRYCAYQRGGVGSQAWWDSAGGRAASCSDLLWAIAESVIQQFAHNKSEHDAARRSAESHHA